jgi:hypothetical protein
MRYLFLSAIWRLILQSLTTSKMRKSQTKKLSQFHKAKTCWNENSWSSGIMSNFRGHFFLCFGGQKKIKIFKKYIVRTEKLHKMKLKTTYFSSAKINHLI